jgi:superfamily I DNA/RNA helicase
VITYTNQLCDDAREKVRRLRGQPPAGLTIETFDQVAHRLASGRLRTEYSRDKLLDILHAVRWTTDPAADFLLEEFQEVIERRDVLNFDSYAQLKRKGRGGRLGTVQRRQVWEAYERFTQALAQTGARTIGAARQGAARAAEALDESAQFDLVIVDEVQDLPASVLAMAVGLARGTGKGKAVMLVGDAGQSIYQSGFRWSDVGLRLGGASVVTLAQSERSTREILAFGRALLGEHGEDHAEAGASKTGPRPRIARGFRTFDHRRTWLVEDIALRISQGVAPQRIAVIAHGKNELAAIRGALNDRHIPTVDYGTARFYRDPAVKIITAHSSKGLEFSEVYVPDANDGIYPFYQNAALDPEERDEHDAQDCKLLYVACTRAGDRLTVMYDRDPSPFLASAAAFAEPMNVGSTGVSGKSGYAM